MPEYKYFKPGSVTWWASLVPLLAGLIVASEPIHGLTSVVESINRATDGAAPAIMINLGLAGIGFRGAV